MHAGEYLPCYCSPITLKRFPLISMSLNRDESALILPSSMSAFILITLAIFRSKFPIASEKAGALQEGFRLLTIGCDFRQLAGELIWSRCFGDMFPISGFGLLCSGKKLKTPGLNLNEFHLISGPNAERGSDSGWNGNPSLAVHNCSRHKPLRCWANALRARAARNDV